MAIYCTKCGRQLPDDAVFCDNCGNRVLRNTNTSSYQAQPAQVPVQQPARYYEPVQQYQNPPMPVQKKKSFFGRLLKFLIALILVGALLFGALVFLEEIYHRTPPESGSPSDSSEQSSSPNGQSSPSAPSVPEDQSSSSSGNTPSDDVPQGVLSPDGEAWFDDFLFYENDVSKNGIPEGAALQSAGYISGTWKYCMTFNRAVEGEERIDEVGIAEVSFTEDTATLILHPQYIRYGSHVEPETDEEVGYEPFTGTWDNEYIDISAQGLSIGLGPYYSYNGNDYVLGNVVSKNTGMFGDFLLVRP